MRPVPVNLLRVEAAHEGEDVATERLAGNEDGEARRVWGDERRRDDLLARLDALQYLIGHEVFAQAVVVGEVERTPQIAFRRLLGLWIVPATKAVMKRAEVGKWGGGVGEPKHRTFVGGPLSRTHVLDAVLQPAGELDENLDQVCHRAARGADVGHEEDRVSRGLVD